MDTRTSLVAVGRSHKTASLSTRERASLNVEDLADALGYLDTRVGNGVILSTCNRTELYFVAHPAWQTMRTQLDSSSA